MRLKIDGPGKPWRLVLFIFVFAALGNSLSDDIVNLFRYVTGLKPRYWE